MRGFPQYRRPTMKGVTQYRSLVRVTAPASEPVTLTEAKTQCRVDSSDDDTYLGTLIQAAREYVEDVLDTALITQVWAVRYDDFEADHIVLPKPPLTSATITVTYIDDSGSKQTLSSASSHFQVDYRAVPGAIYPNYSESWPSVRLQENAVTVQFSCGYGTAADVPQKHKNLMLLLIAHWYEMRQPVVAGYSQVLPVPQTFDTLLAACGWGDYRPWG